MKSENGRKERKKDPCSVCAEIDRYIEIEYPDDDPASAPPWPAAVARLQAPVARLYGDELLRKCPACGAYYAYRNWSPGGSDDALRTYVHESIRPCRCLDAHLIMRESEATIERWYLDDQESWGEAYRTHQSAAADELEYLRKDRFAETAREAIDELKTNRMRRVSSIHSEALLERERQIADVLHGVLMLKTAELPDELLADLAGLLAHGNEAVRARLRGGLGLGLFDLKDKPETLRMIHAGLPKPGGKEAAAVREHVEELLEGELPWQSFYNGPSIRLIGDRMFDDVLREHLESLPGLVVTSYVAEAYTEAIIDFEYEDFHFRGDNGHMSWEFEVRGDLPEAVRRRVSEHLDRIFKE